MKLKMEALKGVYTDGSCRAERGGNRLGAGVFCPEGEVRVGVLPVGEGLTNTIVTAELTAIKHGLPLKHHDASIHLYTDSLTCIAQIKRFCTLGPDSKEVEHCMNRDLLMDISSMIHNRAAKGQHTYIHKVKAHTGACPGNDEADCIATQIAAGKRGYDVMEPIQAAAHDHHTWIGTAKPHTDTTSAPTVTLASNLHQGLKNMLPKETEMGYTNKTVYVNAWEAIWSQIDRCSSACWTAKGATHKMLCNMMKARWGGLWSMKLAHRFKRPYIKGSKTIPKHSRCPMCKEQDGAGHILGGCKHAGFQGLYVNRHNKAVVKLWKAIMKGQWANCFTFMDATSQQDLPEGVEGTRLPAWLLPNTTEAARERMRPDMLLLPDFTADTSPQDINPRNAPQGAHIVEVGYCGDTKVHEKRAEKGCQHYQLVSELEKQGWRVTVHVIPLGHTGIVYTGTRDTLQALGVEDTRCIDKTLSALSRHATEYMQHIISKRRILEASPPAKT
jgi:ribonuclease HI